MSDQDRDKITINNKYDQWCTQTWPLTAISVMPGATSAPPAAPMRAPRIPPNPAKIQVTSKVSSSNSLCQNILFLDIFLAENSLKVTFYF